jgi:hypothetical protein
MKWAVCSLSAFEVCGLHYLVRNQKFPQTSIRKPDLDVFETANKDDEIPDTHFLID